MSSFPLAEAEIINDLPDGVELLTPKLPIFVETVIDSLAGDPSEVNCVKRITPTTVFGVNSPVTTSSTVIVDQDVPDLISAVDVPDALTAPAAEAVPSVTVIVI